MDKASWRDAALLLDMLLAAQHVRAFVAGMDEAAFLASRLHQHAVIRSLEVIGEAAGKVSPAFRAAQAGIPWRVAAERLDPLIAALTPLISDDGGSGA